jgi:hypothetical protein
MLFRPAGLDVVFAVELPVDPLLEAACGRNAVVVITVFLLNYARMLRPT